MDYGLSVQELLNTQYLRKIAKVVAGAGGLTNQVRWVHVLEVRDIVDKCVNGNELVLTTGIGFTSKDVAQKFVQELIDQKVSALCIETALYYHKIHDEVIELADRYDFPIIEISEISRFVDISRGLNVLLMHNESQLYSEADQYDSHLYEISGKGTLVDGIKYTADYLDIDVAFLPTKGGCQFFSSDLTESIGSKIKELKNDIPADEILVCGHYALKRIELLGKIWGHLIFCSKKGNLSDFEILVLSRLSSKIKVDIYADLMAHEKRLYTDNNWIKKWLEGKISESDVRKRLQSVGKYDSFCNFVVCCTKCRHEIGMLEQEDFVLERPKNYEDFILHSTITVKNIFEREGLHSLGYMEDGYIYFIFIGTATSGDICEKVALGLEHLRQCSNPFMDYQSASFSIGKRVSRYIDLYKSCNTALELIKLSNDCINQTIVYDSLFINQIMISIEDKERLREYVIDYLGELLETKNSELLTTLIVYFDSNCSKQQTAERLFIVRQTLYVRLQKISEILGRDFDRGEKRFAIEFAIHANAYLQCNQW